MKLYAKIIISMLLVLSANLIAGNMYPVKHKKTKLNGVVKTYYPNGVLQTESNWKDGKENGISKIYFENGTLFRESKWIRGKENGISKSYREDGGILIESNWKDGKADGIWRIYSDEGTLKRELTFKNGNAISGVYYNKNGSIDRKMTDTELQKIAN